MKPGATLSQVAAPVSSCREGHKTSTAEWPHVTRSHSQNFTGKSEAEARRAAWGARVHLSHRHVAGRNQIQLSLAITHFKNIHFQKQSLIRPFVFSFLSERPAHTLGKLFVMDSFVPCEVAGAVTGTNLTQQMCAFLIFPSGYF